MEDSEELYAVSTGDIDFDEDTVGSIQLFKRRHIMSDWRRNMVNSEDNSETNFT